jgi:hypothetical protein
MAHWVCLHAVEQPTFRPRCLSLLRLEAGDSSLRTESSLPGAMDSPSTILQPFYGNWNGNSIKIWSA